VAFHVDSRCTGLLVQLDLLARVLDDLLGADDRAADNLAPADVRAFHQALAQRRSRCPAATGRHDFVGNDQVAGLQRWFEAAGDTERDDATDACVIERVELGAKLTGIARAADDGHASAGGNARLAVEPGHDKKRPPPGDNSASPHTHMPTPTVLEFVFRRFL
jgi:hypothetical protein